MPLGYPYCALSDAAATAFEAKVVASFTFLGFKISKPRIASPVI